MGDRRQRPSRVAIGEYLSASIADVSERVGKGGASTSTSTTGISTIISSCISTCTSTGTSTSSSSTGPHRSLERALRYLPQSSQ